jgi:hypothetical protein
MALVSLNLKPDKKQLQDFGKISLVMLAALGMLLNLLYGLPLIGVTAFCLSGLAMYISSRISTDIIKPIYVVFVVVTFPIGWVISHLLMGIFYFGIITPVALFFKIIKRDPLCRKADKDAGSYWIKCKNNRSTKDYFNQF